MITRGIHEFVARDWEAARESKASYWAERIDRLGAYRDAGASRVMGLIKTSTTSDEALASLADDAQAAGVEMAAAR